MIVFYDSGDWDHLAMHSDFYLLSGNAAQQLDLIDVCQHSTEDLLGIQRRAILSWCSRKD